MASTGEIYQFDTTGLVLNVYVDPAHATFGGCGVALTKHHGRFGADLAALVQESPDGVVFYDAVTGSISSVVSVCWGRIKSLF